ncbi:hypothetical protein ACT4UT_08450, partial [Bacillus sp. B-TM1]
SKFTLECDLSMRSDVDRIYEIEKETRHDVVAFTRAVSETPALGEERKWVHYGLTSTDVVDTARVNATTS